MTTVLDRFADNCSRLSDKVCLRAKDPITSEWISYTWSEVAGHVASVAGALKDMGVEKGDSVAIFSSTRFEWTVVDLAILSISAVSVPIYNTLGADQVLFILKHSSAKIIFVENDRLMEKIAGVIKDAHALENTVVIDGAGNEKFRTMLTNEHRYTLNDIADRPTPKTIATCVYTSGTTGELKGVLLTHANIMGEVEGLEDVYKLETEDIGLHFLPLAHVIARAMQFFQLSIGCQGAYAESLEKLSEDIIAVKPAFMAVVPRIMEKIYENVLKEVASSSFIIKALFSLAVSSGTGICKQLRSRQKISVIGKAKLFFIRKVIFGKLHRKLGGQLKFIISGGAPLDKKVAEFFYITGVLILEGYGLTETFAGVTVNRLDDFKFGTIGKPMRGVQVRIAEDGEILLKGPQVFSAYRQPASINALDIFVDGWYRTGDLGDFSRDGFLRITGRKKELIITSQGKNISPNRVESVIKMSPYINNAIVFGDRQKYLVALITLNQDRIMEFAGNKDVDELITAELEKANSHLARFETVKKFHILKKEFTQEGGELTPTLKMKRKVIYDKYKDIIERMYN